MAGQLQSCTADQTNYDGSAYQYMFKYKPLADFTPGIQVEPNTCGFAEEQIHQAIMNARVFARAGLMVTKSADTALFDAFFFPEDRDMVMTVFKNIINILLNNVDYPVVITCNDIMKRCNPSDPRSHMAYVLTDPSVHHNDTLAPIVICPENFAQYRAVPDPCDKASLSQAGLHRGTSQALILLHEMIHIDYMAGPSLRFIGDHGSGSFSATALRSKSNEGGYVSQEAIRTPPTQNVDNYAVLAAWAWMQHQQEHRCPLNYRLWNELAILSGQGRGQLRTLLIDGDGAPGNQQLSDQELRDLTNAVGLDDAMECGANCVPNA